MGCEQYERNLPYASAQLSSLNLCFSRTLIHIVRKRTMHSCLAPIGLAGFQVSSCPP
jgi:hypothetical protein